MNKSPDINLWSSPEHAFKYLRRADSIPHRTEGEATLLEFLRPDSKRVLDIGSGAGRLLALVRAARPQAEFVAMDLSPTMLELLRKDFGGDESVTIVAHDFANKLPQLGRFDSVISSLAIHHVSHERKKSLYAEIFDLLLPGGVFCNLEHVSSPTPWLRQEYLKKVNMLPEEEDPSNKLLDMESQLAWFREIGFTHVDCHWKWRELALMVGIRPEVRS